MFEIVTIIIFVWLMCKAIGLAFRLTWGIAKIAASILMVLAMPVLLIGLIFASGIALIVPIILIAAAVGILKSNV